MRRTDLGRSWPREYAILGQEDGWDRWALPKATAHELVAYLETHRPEVVVEGGSGFTTVLLAEYAARHEAKVVTLEHSPFYAGATDQHLTKLGLRDFVDLRLVQATKYEWYHTLLPSNIDFALVDGPPERIGRHGAMRALHNYMNPNNRWQIWMDDANRVDETYSLEMWTESYPIAYKIHGLPRGLAIITPDRLPIPKVDASKVAVTILTGSRPDLLDKTLGALCVWANGLLDSAHVTVLHNGADPETVKYLNNASWVNVLEVHDGPRLTVGEACTKLFTLIPANVPYHLQLQDDWTVGTTFHNWLANAQTTLDLHPEVGQVRLRHRSERVRKYSMVNGKEIRWQRDEHGCLIGNAHYTLNPTLMRTKDVQKLWPAGGEKEAMRRFRGLVAQSDPGVFHHIGADRSLLGHTWGP